VGLGIDTNLSSKRAGLLTRVDIKNNGVTMGTYLDHVKGHVDAAKAARKFESTKNSDYGRDSSNPFVSPDVGIKNYSDPATRSRGQDGNSILLNVDPQGTVSFAEPGNPQIGPLRDDAPVVQKKISEVLRQNRFNPIEKAFVQNRTWTGPGTTLQRQLGTYVKDSQSIEIKQGLLEQVGLKLMIRATGHSVPGQDLLNDTNSLQETNNYAPLIPSAPQLTGLPLIPVVNLMAGNVDVSQGLAGVGVTPESARAEYIDKVDFEPAPGSTSSTWNETFDGRSYGVLNSHIEPFSGGLPVGTFTTTLAGIVLIVGASFLITALPLILNRDMATVDHFDPTGSSMLNIIPANLTMGRHTEIRTNGGTGEYAPYNRLQEFIFELLGIPRTNHRWEQCLLQGIGAFFGVGIREDFSIDGELLGENIYYLLTAPGYYAVVIRNAIRDVEQIVKAIESFAEAGSAGNIVAIVSGIFSLIDSITSSALYRFFMTMTALGNQVLNASIHTFDISLRVNEEDREYSGPGRGHSGEVPVGALSWRHSAALSFHLIPGSLGSQVAGFIDMGYNGTPRGPGSRVNQFDLTLLGPRRVSPGGLRSIPAEQVPARDARLTAGDVKTIESLLDAEHVPFYFHDLRTNEIISFHAFLSDLSDGFSVNYTNTTGYGRADEVMIYNNTKRTIGFTFHVVATSEKDFDIMYWNINRLITMLYPQYSAGRQMTTSNIDFIQPFSQIQTASPMIRLRIGDIVKGNYSRFALARLFGFGTTRMDINREIARRQAAVDNGNNGNARISAENEAIEARNAARLRSAAETRVNTWTEARQARPINERYVVGDEVNIRPVTILAGIDNVEFRDSRGGAMAVLGSVAGVPTRTRKPDAPAAYLSIPRTLSSVRTPADLRVKIISLSGQPNFPSPPPSDNPPFGYHYAPATSPSERHVIAFVEIQNMTFNLPEGPAGMEVLGNYRYMYINLDFITRFDNTYVVAQLENEPVPEDQLRLLSSSLEPTRELNNTRIANSTVFREFFEPATNPIVRSFESTKGKGLAGFITDLKMDWGESTWEIDRGRQAPKSMKLSISFSPIHDIPMGLDSDGAMRSVAYNVGELSHYIGSDPYATDPTPEG